MPLSSAGEGRHTFATHAARFGANPWTLQAWLGHSGINMTMRYARHVQAHHRPIPEEILPAQIGLIDLMRGLDDAGAIVPLGVDIDLPDLSTDPREGVGSFPLTLADSGDDATPSSL